MPRGITTQSLAARVATRCATISGVTSIAELHGSDKGTEYTFDVHSVDGAVYSIRVQQEIPPHHFLGANTPKSRVSTRISERDERTRLVIAATRKRNRVT